MASEKFTIDDALRTGWEVVIKNIPFFILLMIVSAIVPIIIVGIIGIGAAIFAERAPLLSIILGIMGAVAGLVIFATMAAGYIRITLKFCAGEKGRIDDLFSFSVPLFFNFCLASILYGLIVSVGMVLLIIPGIILAIRFQFWGHLIVDKRLSAINALKESSVLTKGYTWDLFVFGMANTSTY